MYGEMLLAELLKSKGAISELPQSISAPMNQINTERFVWDYEGRTILRSFCRL